jgi:hypothetical protein
VVEPCRFCGEVPIACECKDFEDGEPAPIRNPDWWRQVSRVRDGRAAVPMEEWAATLLGERSARVSRVVA